MEEKKRQPYPRQAEKLDPNDPAMKCVYFGPQPIIPNTLLGYAGPNPCSGMVMNPFNPETATPSEAKKPENENPEDYVFCKTCGAKMLKKGKFCPECGSINENR